MIRINSLQVKMMNNVRVLKYVEHVEPCSFLFQMAVNLISKHFAVDLNISIWSVQNIGKE